LPQPTPKNGGLFLSFKRGVFEKGVWGSIFRREGDSLGRAFATKPNLLDAGMGRDGGWIPISG